MFLRTFALLFALTLTLHAAPPNLIFILVDDLGATDLSCYGSKFYETPHIDKLAAEGMKFTQAYSACTVCSPTRASLLTGKSPAALHVTDWIAGHQRPFAKLNVPDWTRRLKAEENTLAERLKKLGYATASIGKWHLGDAPPTEHGFDVNIGGTSRGSPPSYFAPYKIPTLPDGPTGEFLSDRLTTEAEKFIEAHRDGPFFIYLPHFAVHTPIMGKPEVVAKYQAKAKPDDAQKNAKYAALVESVDDSVGRLRAKLEALGIAKNTLIVFASDNGGLVLNQVTSNLGMRAGKGSAYEGGVRTALIYWWPGTIAPAVSAEPVITGDHFYTLLELAGTVVPPAEEFRSLAPLLRGGNELGERTLSWHYPHYHPGGATPYSAVRAGDFRLVHFFEDDRDELYDLKADPEESHDLATENPAKAQAMRERLTAMWKVTGAQMPTKNPDHDPAREEKKAGKAAKAAKK